MRFTYAEAMIDPAIYLPLAQAVEDAGYDSITIADSICYPRESDSTYPYTPDGNREFLEDKPFIEPFSLIPALGAVTSRLRFTTFVVKLPMRGPVIIAKQAASVAVLTNNRLRFGVGSSPWPDDYEICGVPWARRGKRMDEMVEIVRGLTNGGWFEYHGEIFDIPAIKITPVPTEPIPLLIGGHHDAALRRAARLCDGWVHAGGDPDEMATMIARLDELRREYGREKEPFEIHVISLDAYTPDGVRRLEDLGVTDAIVGFRYPYIREQDTEPLQKKVDDLRRFADAVIARCS
jgi:probable F420-dependent oxidoreductase